METLAQDVRFAVRSLGKAPGFTLVAILTLALGIGVNSAIFSVVNAVLFRPLPVSEPQQLVEIYGRETGEETFQTHSWQNYLSYREATTTLTDLVAYSNFFGNLALDGRSEMVIGELVSDNYFSALGVRPAIGRSFTPEEAAPIGGATYAVISDRLWHSQFNAAPDIAGRTFRLDGRVYTILGVAPEEFRGMFPGVTAQMWIPVAMAEEVEPLGNQRVPALSPGTNRFDRRGLHWLWMKGRMKPGVTAAQVGAEFDGLVIRLGEEYPALMAKERVVVVPTSDVRINPDADRVVAPAGLLLVVAVGLVLMVACANLANLMLARAAGRGHEIAVRVALGATRGRIARQLITESLVLALAGGALAVPLASALTALVTRVQPPLPIDLGLSVSPDWRVMLFTLAVAIGTGVLFGLVPAIRASRPDLVPALKEAASDGKRGRFRLRDALVVAQMAVSLVLIVGGSLFVRSLSAAAQVPLGYDSDRLGYLVLPLEMIGYDATRGGQFFATGADRLRAMPEVEAVALANRLPLSINNNGFSIHIAGQPRPDGRGFAIDGASVDEHYITAMGLQLLAGRGIEAADRDESRLVTVITQTMAERFWPGGAENALEREIRLRETDPAYRVIGVVADHKVDTPGEAPKSYILLPLRRNLTYGNYIVRTRTPAAPLIAAMERELRVLEPDLVFMDRGTFRDMAGVRLFPVRAAAWLIGACGLLALLVAAIGLYGVISYSVSRRVRELGIRAALGAEPGALVRMVIREGMLLVLIGGAIGAALAAGAAQVLKGALFVAPFDPISFLAAAGVLGVAALLANAVPAWRASKVDPIVALRSN